MTDPQPATAPAFYEQTWDLSYRHALGETTGRFLAGLKDHTILGRRCPGCERVLVPARSFCDRCYRSTGDWVEVGRAGAIEMFTIVYEPFKGLPEPPYALAYVTLDGADTALVGYVKGIDLTDTSAAVESMRIGRRVVTRFAPEPTGTVLDYWFELQNDQWT
jgi:uncharacterized OB-fold protein